MILQGIMTISLLVAFGGTTFAECPAMCTSCHIEAECRNLGFLQPPAGYWPDITDLIISSNNISILTNKSFSGFPNLTAIRMGGNPLTVLDFGVFGGLNQLNLVRAPECSFTNIIALSADKVLPELQYLQIYNNKITSLPNNLISNFPKLEELDVYGNPILIPATGPWIPSDSLRSLRFSDANASGITSETFEGLPNLNYLSITYSGLDDISEKFAVLPNLKQLLVSNNPIKVIRKGTFSKEQKLELLELRGSQLEILETEALDGILVGSLSIEDTPLACECKYESIYWWAQNNGIVLKVTCENTLPCQFEKK